MSSTAQSDSLFQQRRSPVELSGLAFIALSFQTLGVEPFTLPVLAHVYLIQGIIYSDIGTSPLYVLNGIWPASGPVPSEEDVIGGISAIIWSLTILPLIKYVSAASDIDFTPTEMTIQFFFVLRFGTHEG